MKTIESTDLTKRELDALSDLKGLFVKHNLSLMLKPGVRRRTEIVLRFGYSETENMSKLAVGEDVSIDDINAALYQA